MQRVAAYIRVSTDEQAEHGNSLSEQKERLEAYCVAKGWGKPKLFIDDGYSAKNMNRPHIKKLIKGVESNKFDIVITSKLDRLCRNLLELLQFVELLDNHDCNYVSSSEGFDTTTAAGRMVLQILGSFAEFERERTSERVKDNMLSLAKNTDKALTKPCFGYDVIDAQYVINKEEEEYVRYMFDLAEDGLGHRMIAKLLNDKGVTTRKGKMWDSINTKRLLRNETLAGIRIYNKRKNKNGKVVMRDKSEWIIDEDNHPAIITKEQFYKVQGILDSRSKARKHADNESYLLTGLVRCGHCGKNMKGSTSRMKTKYNNYTYYRYICSSYTLGYGCKHHALHRDDLEKLIVDEIEKLARTSEQDINIKIGASALVVDELKEVREQLAKSDKKMQKQIEAYENDLISADDLKAARLRLDAERERLKKQLNKLESKKSGSTQSVQNNINAVLSDVVGKDRHKAKNAIRTLVEQITVKDGKVEILWVP